MRDLTPLRPTCSAPVDTWIGPSFCREAPLPLLVSLKDFLQSIGSSFRFLGRRTYLCPRPCLILWHSELRGYPCNHLFFTSKFFLYSDVPPPLSRSEENNGPLFRERPEDRSERASRIYFYFLFSCILLVSSSPPTLGYSSKCMYSSLLPWASLTSCDSTEILGCAFRSLSPVSGESSCSPGGGGVQLCAHLRPLPSRPFPFRHLGQ